MAGEGRFEQTLRVRRKLDGERPRVAANAKERGAAESARNGVQPSDRAPVGVPTREFLRQPTGKFRPSARRSRG